MKLSPVTYKKTSQLKVRELGDNRDRLLHQGRLKIVSFLSDLPKTEHFMNSFTLDITLATGHLMAFTVTGLFLERAVPEQGIARLRYFDATFVILEIFNIDLKVIFQVTLNS